ncbi:MAG TPA: rRNA maturation RNase YbeY [Candidatus Obscuribacterales bacterium]
MDISINLEMDPFTAPYVPDNHRWVAFMESLGKEMEVVPEAELSLTLTDNTMMQTLNQHYREIAKPTDVLAFPQDMENNLLGDIIISVEKAKEQATEKQHSLEYEIALLATHGFLHLMGYDHAEEEDEKIMFALQDDLLNKYYADCFKAA